MKTVHKLLLASLVLTFVFIGMRAKQYFHDRKYGDHDRYMIVANPESGFAYRKCPDMNMFGFKFSSMITLMILNLFLTILILTKV